MDARHHWQSVYTQKSPESVSWFQATPTLSHALITQIAPALDTRIFDVGGGASTLVDALLTSGYTSLSVLDVSPAALAHARERLGAAAEGVTWIAADILDVVLPAESTDVWHDRAVFHFLTHAEQRARYFAQVRYALRPGGYVVIATFADDGPTRCSGLDTARYSASELHDAFGEGFTLVRSERELHVTPSGAAQAFTYCVCRWSPV